MRRWIITAALLANALLGGLVLLLLLNGGGWGEATTLSATEGQLLVIVALVALALDLLLVPVLGISFWARDRRSPCGRFACRIASSAACTFSPPTASSSPRMDRLPSSCLASERERPSVGSGSTPSGSSRDR